MSTTEDRQLRARVDKLREELNYHAKKYYVEDAPEISDYEYDRLFYELVHIEQEHPELDDPASPTHRVGGKASDRFEKVTHSVRMDSLTDVFPLKSLKNSCPMLRSGSRMPYTRSSRRSTGSPARCAMWTACWFRRQRAGTEQSART